MFNFTDFFNDFYLDHFYKLPLTYEPAYFTKDFLPPTYVNDILLFFNSISPRGFKFVSFPAEMTGF